MRLSILLGVWLAISSAMAQGYTAPVVLLDAEGKPLCEVSAQHEGSVALGLVAEQNLSRGTFDTELRACHSEDFLNAFDEIAIAIAGQPGATALVSALAVATGEAVEEAMPQGYWDYLECVQVNTADNEKLPYFFIVPIITPWWLAEEVVDRAKCF